MEGVFYYEKRIGVVFGGRSVEHEVSVITGMQVVENLDKSKYEVVPIFIDKEGRWLTGDELFKFENFKNDNLKSLKEVILTSKCNDRKLYSHPDNIGFFGKKQTIEIDAVFVALHGTYGEDGTIQGLFETLNIPYTSGGVLASSVGMDKILMKDVYKSYGLPIVNYTWFFRKKWNDDKEGVLKEVEEKLTYPLFVKPANLGSSVGISKAKDKKSLEEAIEVAIRYDRKIIIEEGVENPRELNCAVIGYDDNVKASLCEEPLGWTDLLTYEDKYVHSNSKGAKGGGRNIPADISEEKAKEIQETAKKAFMAIDCKGTARIDFLMDKDENIYVNEINTQPGSIGYYLWDAMGISFGQLLDQLIEIAIVVQKDKNESMYSYDVDLFDKVQLGGGSKTSKI
ncbi:D-alanine--D-alanine ligase Ddl [Gottschalkia acidurici 9a]|uniref:D-alanine--D-alanine ligase n=1 Tax=Gottschalkia acidurici (strain ATCC 7906 / DSM 604 / BCRC 14475 / CIP 104303 / KCTC 5404 / NCIMB 10678 / 9a) TaxID=1128398 RepID=K0AY17_GOTA9|nr:D-alanine--D-alanine ligase family protein [Gottschalkia acidurici]AFS78109.1 D-alanine--D-alanine ligase Ddl [Gottschalkia acidurici 9a]